MNKICLLLLYCYPWFIYKERNEFLAPVLSLTFAIGNEHSVEPLLSGHLLRTFARKFSNIDFFLRLLPIKVDELVMSEL